MEIKRRIVVAGSLGQAVGQGGDVRIVSWDEGRDRCRRVELGKRKRQGPGAPRRLGLGWADGAAMGTGIGVGDWDWERVPVHTINYRLGSVTPRAK